MLDDDVSFCSCKKLGLISLTFLLILLKMQMKQFCSKTEMGQHGNKWCGKLRYWLFRCLARANIIPSGV